MSTRDLSNVEIGDRHRRYIAFALLAVGLKYAVSAAMDLVGPELVPVLGKVEVVMAVLIFVFLAPVFLYKLRSPRREWPLHVGDDGFVADAFARAQVASWGTTFVLVALLAPLTDRLANLTAEFFLNLVLATMTVVLSTAFLFLSRGPEGEEPEGEEREGEEREGEEREGFDA